MSSEQYEAYCGEFNLCPKLQPPKDRTVNGIGGWRQSIGTATIALPFKWLGIQNFVSFIVIHQNVPTLLSMKYMMKNVLYISIKEMVVILRNRTHKLEFENYVLIRLWGNKTEFRVLYAYTEL